jgi:hypothetical protein
MKKLLVISALLTAFLIGAVASSAQTRVKFKKGATSAVLSGKLSNYKQKRVFLVRVHNFQKLEIRDIGSHAVSIWVEGPPASGYEQDLAADCHGQTDVSPTAAGDYKLTVQECQKVDQWRGKFKVKVTVR